MRTNSRPYINTRNCRGEEKMILCLIVWIAAIVGIVAMKKIEPGALWLYAPYVILIAALATIIINPFINSAVAPACKEIITR